MTPKTIHPLEQELQTIIAVWNNLTTGAWTYNSATGEIFSRKTGRPLRPRTQGGVSTVTVHIGQRTTHADIRLIARMERGLALSRRPTRTGERK